MTKFRHKKRGTTYEVIGEAEIQISIRTLEEGDIVIIYKDEKSGKLWARNRDEFFDGRFEEISEERR